MKAQNSTILAAFALPFVAGCVGGPTHDFYRPTGAVAIERPTGAAMVVVSSRMHDTQGRVHEYMADGYKILGTSDYVGREAKPVELTAQAKRVGASIVLYDSKYIDTITGINSFSVPNPPQTVRSETYGSMYGNGGLTYFSGTTTTTVPGGYTDYAVPYAIPMYEVHEVFLGR